MPASTNGALDGRASAMMAATKRPPRRTAAALIAMMRTYIALGILDTAPIEPCGLRLGLSLRLPAAAVVVVLACDRGQHVEQHGVDGREHPAGEVVALAGRHQP